MKTLTGQIIFVFLDWPSIKLSQLHSLFLKLSWDVSRVLILKTHMCRFYSSRGILLSILILVAACLVACASTPISEESNPMDLKLRRHGVGNIWHDIQGARFVEMSDQSGSSYFLRPSGDIMCCYKQSQSSPGFFMYLHGIEFDSPTTSESVVTASPEENIESHTETLDDPSPYLDSGFAYIETDDYAEALESFSNALSVQQDISQAYLGIGQAHFHLGNYAASVRSLEQALLIDPTLDEVHYFHSLASLRLLSFDMALDEYFVGVLSDTELLSGDSNGTEADILINPGSIRRYDEDDYREMLFHINIVVGEIPGDPKLYTVRGIVHALLKDYESAISDLDFALRLDSGLAIAYLKRSIVYHAVDMLDEAISDYVTATNSDPSLSNTDFERILLQKYTDDVLNREFGDEDPLVRRANAYRELRSNSLALADYARAIETNPVSEWAYLNRARLYLNLGQIESAIIDLSQSIEFNPLISAAYSLRAEAFLILSRQASDDALSSDLLERSIAEYAQAIQLDPTNVDLYLSRGDVRRDAGRFELALADYSRALNFEPESSRAFLQRGNLYYAMAQQRVRVANLERALDDYTAALKFDPANVQCLIARSKAYIGLGQATMAIEDLLNALKLSSDKGDVLTTIGDTYHNLGEFNLALEYFTMAIEIEPQSDVLFLYRARSYRALASFELALDDLSRASELSPEKPLYYIEKANLFIELGRHSEAITALTGAIELLGDELELYVTRANEYEQLGQYGLAANDYSQALRLDPRNLELIYRHTLTLISLEDFEQALNSTRTGFQASEDDARLLVASGDANLGLGLYEAALLSYNKALSKPSSELNGSISLLSDADEAFQSGDFTTLDNARSAKTEIHLGRAKALMGMGQYQDALQAFDKAIELVPDPNPDLYWHRATARLESICALTSASSVVEIELAKVRGGVVGVTVEFILGTEIRSGPGEEYPLVASESGGFTSDLTGQSESGDWYEISYGPSGYGLWVRSSDVLTIGDMEIVPTVTTPASVLEDVPYSIGSSSTCNFDQEYDQDLLPVLVDYTTAINLASTTRYHIDRGYVNNALDFHQQALEDVALAINSDWSEFSRVQLERARQIYEEHLELNSADGAAYGVYATLLTRTGADEIALGAITSAIEHSPENPDWYQERGDIYTRMGDLESAIDDYAIAFDLSPGNMSLVKLHADVAVKLAEELRIDPALQRESEAFYQLALDDFNELFNFSPDDAELYVTRAHVYESMGSHDFALDDYNSALEIDPSVADWYVKRAAVLAGISEPNLAFADYKQAISMRPYDSELYFERSKLHAVQDNHVLALEDITRAIALDKRDPMYWEVRAQYYSSSNDPQNAMTDLTTAIELSGDNTELYTQRAMAWTELGQFRQAISDYNTVLDLVADNPDHYFGRARAYIGLRDFSLALDDLDQSISMDPNIHEYYASRSSALMGLYSLGAPKPEVQADEQSVEQGDDSRGSDSNAVEEIALPEVHGRSVGVTVEFVLGTEIRSGPGEQYPLVASEIGGFTADLTGQSESGDWYEISYGPNNYGLWVRGNEVIVTGDLDRAPIVDDSFYLVQDVTANNVSSETGSDAIMAESYLAEQTAYDTLLEEAMVSYGTAIEIVETESSVAFQTDDGQTVREILTQIKAEYHAGRASVWRVLSEPQLEIVDASGKSHFTVDELWNARSDYDAAIVLSGDNPQYLSGRSEINFLLGLSEAALADHLAAVELDPLVSDVLYESILSGGEFRYILGKG